MTLLLLYFRVLQPSLVTYRTRELHLQNRPDCTEEKEDDRPIKFSTSKGSHRRWTVAQSFGSDHQRPWWKVLPLSLFLTAVLVWAYFREETEIDEIIYRPISELLGEIDRNEKKDKNE
ncbi:ubiquinol-cytochrome c reductase complex assembly factor 4 [Ranitomeya imitator]|uniref:ubiquinol-cytochrome c reductase complex assembly factor 4 n=1 Tax=Ranitomeya imitator TaxID=111125 RepID=UPI001AA8287A